jgi:hypothetical protein
MTAMINESRRTCPQTLARGSCYVPDCPYNHEMVSTNERSTSNNDVIIAQTGSYGQFVGAQKGGNAVPIKQTGGIPSFLQNRIKQNTLSTRSLPERPGGSFNVPRSVQTFGPPPTQNTGQYSVRTGGNEHQIPLSGVFANIPAQRETKAESVRIDWKAAAMSKVASLRGKEPEANPRRRELEEELANLQSIATRKMSDISRLDQEIEGLRRRREDLNGNSVDVRQTQVASEQLLALMERGGSISSAINSERLRMKEAFDEMELTGLVKMSEIYKAQCLVLDEISLAFQKYKELSEYTLCEFKHIVFKARNTPQKTKNVY